MPVMDGIEATREIRRLEMEASAIPTGSSNNGPRVEGTRSSGSGSFRSSVIIVALTASSLQSDRVNALAAGCNDFLTKPVSLVWLNSKIIEWGSLKALQMYASASSQIPGFLGGNPPNPPFIHDKSPRNTDPSKALTIASERRTTKTVGVIHDTNGRPHEAPRIRAPSRFGSSSSDDDSSGKLSKNECIFD